MKSSKPQEGTGKLKASKEIHAILIISDKNGSALGKPGQCPLNHPATGWVCFLTVFVQFLLANPANMWNVACCLCCGMACGVVIAFIEAQMLGSFCGRLRPRNDNGIQCLGQELGVMNIGTRNSDSKGSATGFSGKADFRSCLASICGVSSNFVATETSFAHSPIHSLPLPAYSVQFLTSFDQYGPNPFKDPVFTPSLKPAMGSAIICHLPGQVVPLYSRTNSVDDGVENQPETTPTTPPSLGWVGRVEHCRENGPQPFWNFPNSRQIAVGTPVRHVAPPMLGCWSYG